MPVGQAPVLRLWGSEFHGKDFGVCLISWCFVGGFSFEGLCFTCSDTAATRRLHPHVHVLGAVLRQSD